MPSLDGRPPDPRTGLIEAAQAQLAERGVETSGIQVLDPRDGGTFLFFRNPDGNNWAVQEIRDHVGANPL